MNYDRLSRSVTSCCTTLAEQGYGTVNYDILSRSAVSCCAMLAEQRYGPVRQWMKVVSHNEELFPVFSGAAI